MTHAEMYEIVKDHPDVWGKHFIVEDYGGGLRRFVRHFTHQAEECKHAEMELLGLGVEWLVENDKGLMILPKDNSGNYRVSAWSAACDSTPMLAAVYAAIAEVKKAKA